MDLAEELVEELLRTAFSIGSTFVSLLEDLPDDAFPGEEPADVLLEMIAGSSAPAVEAAGEAACRNAIALVGAVRDRVLDDLRAAAQMAEGGG